MFAAMKKRQKPEMMDEHSEEEGDEDFENGGKLLALQHMIEALEEMSDEDLKPYVEELKNKVHLAHEKEEGDEIGVEEAEEKEKKPKIHGLEIEVETMKSPKMNKKEMEDKEEESDEDYFPENPFMTSLSKKLKKKFRG